MAINLKKLIKKYSGKWVAFKPETNKVISSGNTAKMVFEKAKKKGVETPTLFKVPVKYIPNIG